MKFEAFTTPRLSAHRVAENDYDDYRIMRSDPRVAAWLGGQIDEAAHRKHHDETLAHWERYGFGIWMLRSLATDEFVGRVGLRHSLSTGSDEVELLYAMLPKFWKQGLCTEASKHALIVGFESLGLNEIVAFTMTTNLASRRVMEKCGMTYERDFTHANLPHVLYRKQKL